MEFELDIFLWHITIAILFVYGSFSLALYFNSKRNLFLYYSLYTFLLALFVFDKNNYTAQIPVTPFTKIFNWYVQIMYHVMYYWFGLAFVNYFQHFKKQKKRLLYYTYIIFALGTISFAYSAISENVDFYINYFIYVHVPLAVSGLIYIILNILRVKEPMNMFYIPGMIIYIIFSVAALHYTFNSNEQITFKPISFLYIGILAETTVFAIGMGYQTQKLYNKTLRIEKELNKAQIELQKNLKIQLAQIDLENTVNKLKVNSLQDQLNSHFIFNILNSIKSFIIDNDQESAINFLNKYAKLMREYLKGSNLETNDLADEVKTVELYLALENMRLNYSLNFEMIIDNEINLKSLKIPTHILIPFVENAIWKGLLRKKGERKLLLNIKNKEDKVLIEITDNGDYIQTFTDNQLRSNLTKSMEIVNAKIETYNQSNQKLITYSSEFSANGGRQTLEIPNYYSN